MSLIEIRNLFKTYPKTTALNHVSLDLEANKVVGLLGPNGSGKTTLIKILTGLLKQYDGTVKIDGGPIGVHSKSIISYLPDQLYFEKWMKIKDLSIYFQDMFKDFDVSKFNDLLYKFKIDDRGAIKNLSKGNKEKLQLALVLSRNAQIYIFDEPIGGVDPALRQIILDSIEENRHDNSLVIISTHQIYDVESLFDEVIFLKEGNLLLHKPTKQLIEEYNGMNLNDIFKEVFRYV